MTNFPYAQARADYEQTSTLGVARTSDLEAGGLCREESGENEGLHTLQRSGYQKSTPASLGVAASRLPWMHRPEAWHFACPQGRQVSAVDCRKEPETRTHLKGAGVPHYHPIPSPSPGRL